jgi:serum/glucocorticoid-regulated kinase 2
MLTGLPPFYSENVQEMYQSILSRQPVFNNKIGSDAADLLSKLLQVCHLNE